MACHPKFSAAQRIVVVAKLVGNPAPTTEKSPESKVASDTSTGTPLLAETEGLAGGDPDARLHAVGWGLLAAGVWLVTYLVARRWSWRQVGKWLTYAVGAAVFAVPLFLAFESINQLLPAGY